MRNRLEVAKELLTDDGVFFASCDDNEQAYLKVLMDEIFGNENFITNFAVIRAEGGGLAKQVVKGHDYLLTYAKNIENFEPLRKPKDIRGEIVEKDGKKYWIEEDWLRIEFGKYGTCYYEDIERIKFAARASWYLGKDRKNRAELFEVFRELYKCRSRVVHGGELKENVTIEGESVPIEKFITKAQDLCRDSIEKIIKQCSRKGKFPDWNNLILG